MDTLLKWSEENLTAEKLTLRLKMLRRYTGRGSLLQETSEVIRSQMNHQFMNLDQQMLENLY